MIFPRESTPESANEAVNAEDWRDQVASRVNSYRQRRGRKLEGEFSMRFDFEPVAPQSEQAVVADSDEFLENDTLPDISLKSVSTTGDATDISFLDKIDPLIASIPQDPPAPDWSALAQHVEESSTNVIEFPKTATLMPEPPPPPAYEIAEPVFETPRILDVPEQPVYPTVSGPLFADLSFADLTPQEQPQEVYGPPVPIASIRTRVLAGLVDCVMVGIGIALFQMIVLHWMNPAPTARTLLFGAGIATLAVWCIYEYVFLVHGAATLGMKLFHLQLVDFTGRPAPKHQRIQRAVALPLSAVSLCAGFFWAFADEDALCWHDRMSQTYLSK